MFLDELVLDRRWIEINCIANAQFRKESKVGQELKDLKGTEHKSWYLFCELRNA